MRLPPLNSRRSLRAKMLVAGALGVTVVLGGNALLLGTSARMRSQLSAAVDTWAEEEVIADRISQAVVRQLLVVSRMRTREGRAMRGELRAAGDIVYRQLRAYLGRNLTAGQRLQLETVKEEHQRLEVAAAHTADLFGRGETQAGEASFDVMSTHGFGMLDALDTFRQMREAEVEQLREAQNSAFRRLHALSAVFGALLLLAATMWGRFMYRRIDRPLADLTVAARQMERGDLVARVPEAHDVEFAAVGATFNNMAAALAEAHGATRRSEQSFRHLFTNNPLSMWVYDLETLRFLEVNDAAVEHYGYSREDFLGMRLTDIRPPEDVPRLLADVAQERADLQESGDWRHRLKDGRIIDVDITSHLLAFDGRRAALVVAQDITRRKRAEADLRQAQKMEAVGQLTGGIAHDFNNILVVILGFARLAIDQLAESDPIREDIREIYDAGERAAELTRQLLAFSRQQILQPQVISLIGVLDGLEKMLRRLLGENIEIEVRRADGLGNVLADPGQMQQVIINLAVNARDAMPAGGRLTIETGNADLDEEYAEQHATVTPGRYVQLSVTDTGMGMTAATRDRIFEPFFTTKEKGTGLGLATAYGIVKQSGGNIWVYSEPGAGTTFKIYLPRVDAPAADLAEKQAAAAATGNETILIADDEDAVRRATARILERAGYRVLTAADGIEALSLCERHLEEIALLITDVVMPHMSGRELEQRAKALNPRLKVLFISGYADNAIVHHGALDPGTRFIGKPFSVNELRRKVREVLDEQ